MQNKNYEFPKDFLWGASTSAYQVEGAYDADNKGLSVKDVHWKDETKIANFKTASKHYELYKEDVKLFAELGLKSYRFSIAWTRILPNGTGDVNQRGIDFYNNLINELLKYNITPIITIYHFDLPWALEEKGGWSNRKTIDAFVNYCDVLFKNFGDRVKYWLTINEQNVALMVDNILNRKKNVDLPEKEKLKKIYQESHHMFLANALATKLCHQIVENGKISLAPNISSVYPSSPDPIDVIAASNLSEIKNWYYLDIPVFGKYPKYMWSYLSEIGCQPTFEPEDEEILANAKPDFIAFNYYSTAMAGDYNKAKLESQTTDQQSLLDVQGVAKVTNNKYLPKSEYGWTIDPIGFRLTARELFNRYKLPLMITENGLGAKDTLTADKKIHDDYRIDYLKQHLRELHNAISKDGIEIISYNLWSAIDLVSTHEGFSKRYGLIYVNRDENEDSDFQRYKKDSFYWYQNVIKSNGSSLIG